MMPPCCSAPQVQLRVPGGLEVPPSQQGVRGHVPAPGLAGAACPRSQQRSASASECLQLPAVPIPHSAAPAAAAQVEKGTQGIDGIVISNKGKGEALPCPSCTPAARGRTGVVASAQMQAAACWHAAGAGPSRAASLLPLRRAAPCPALPAAHARPRPAGPLRRPLAQSRRAS
jgi:hypothetical protein